MQSISNSAIKPPCSKNCSNRQVGCHSYCNKYKDYVNKKNELSKLIRKNREINEALNSISITTCNKIKKQRNLR